MILPKQLTQTASFLPVVTAKYRFTTAKHIPTMYRAEVQQQGGVRNGLFGTRRLPNTDCVTFCNYNLFLNLWMYLYRWTCLRTPPWVHSSSPPAPILARIQTLITNSLRSQNPFRTNKCIATYWRKVVCVVTQSIEPYWCDGGTQ